MSINVVERIDDRVAVRHVLVSVSDKSGLERFIPGLVGINPELKIFSTGGTFSRIGEILGERAQGRLVQVSDYTGQPETQGGLVKTLDFKIYLGLLTETYNEAHQQDLRRTAAVSIDMVVVNLYPFQQTVARPEVIVREVDGEAVYARSAFVSQNGQVVDDDGVTAEITFDNALEGEYFIVVRHRNHAPVMTANAVEINANN